MTCKGRLIVPSVSSPWLSSPAQTQLLKLYSTVWTLSHVLQEPQTSKHPSGTEERKMEELSRGVIPTHISLRGEKALFTRINEKRCEVHQLLIKILFLLSEPPQKFKTQRPKSFSNIKNISTKNQSCPGIPGAPHRGRGAHELPTKGILTQTGNSTHGDSTCTLKRLLRWHYYWITQCSHICAPSTRRGTGEVLEGGRENPSRCCQLLMWYQLLSGFLRLLISGLSVHPL